MSFAAVLFSLSVLLIMDFPFRDAELADAVVSSFIRPEQHVSPEGAVAGNHDGSMGVRIQGEGGYYTLLLGLMREDDCLIDLGLKAVAFGLDLRCDNGSYQNSSLQDCARFCWFSFLAGETAQRYTSHTDQAEDLLSGLFPSIRLLFICLPDHQEVYAASNQTAAFGYLFAAAGAIEGDSAMVEAGVKMIREVLDDQRNNGVFPENGGHDSHYQAQTLLALCYAADNPPDGIHRDTIVESIARGCQWECSRITDEGMIIDNGNTRTMHDPTMSTEGKQIDPVEIAFALLRVSALDQELAYVSDYAQLIVNTYL